MLDKVMKIVGWVVIGVAALVGILFFVQDAGELESALAATKDMPADMKIIEVDKTAQEWGGLVLNISLYLFVACAVLAVGFAIYKFVADAIDSPKSAIKPLISLVAIVVMVVVSYAMASDAIPQFLGVEKFEVTASASKWIETSLIGMYILTGLAVVALVYGEVSKIWK